MRIHFIKSKEKKQIISQLEEQYGITKLPYLLIESGKEKTRAFSGHLSKDEIKVLDSTINIEFLGLYLLKKEQDFRLSLDATHLLKSQITKNIIELSDSEFQSWIRGKDLELPSKKGTLVIKHNQDFLGCTKSNSEILFNYVPKDRRLKKN
tara:strand:- start:3017 stop:3469 length:453 start_codon:yes stop_codon:yes gene_type:complete